jgi:hypothetical protein
MNLNWKEFLKPTKGKITAFIVLAFLAVYLWLPAPYAGTLASSLGPVGEVIANISLTINFLIVLAYAPFLNYQVLFFLLTLAYDYIIICVVAKVLKKFNPNLQQWKLFIIIFIALEIIAFIIGSFFTWHALCSICPIGQECGPCPSGNYSNIFLWVAIVPNLIISFAISHLIRKHKAKK